MYIVWPPIIIIHKGAVEHCSNGFVSGWGFHKSLGDDNVWNILIDYWYIYIIYIHTYYIYIHIIYIYTYIYIYIYTYYIYIHITYIYIYIWAANEPPWSQYGIWLSSIPSQLDDHPPRPSQINKLRRLWGNSNTRCMSPQNMGAA